ncbi:MAG: TlpA family protein disulfide reductase [Actinomycetia bacterium]|nr:TlpA family protein disulfide reductase [Actinomycetes bacterium]
MRRLAGTALAALVCVGGVSCAPPTSDDDSGGASLPAADLSDIDVDTPELAKLKRTAGMADCPRTDSDAEPVDDGLPELTLSCLGGGRDVNLAALRGEPTVINVWASWCGPCREELPLIARLHDSGRVRVLGIDIEDPQPRTALELAADSGVTYPSVADPGGDTKAPLKIMGVPQTIFVRADGSIAGTKPGEYKKYADLTSDVREHLGVEL